MADIFREIDEELRQERYAVLWQKHGRKVIGVAVLLVLLTAAFVAWQDRQRRQAEALGARYGAIVALTGTDKGRAEKDFEALSDNGSDGYRLLARFQAALLKIQTGDTVAGTAALKTISGDDRIDQSYRDTAGMLESFSTIDGTLPAETLKNLTSLTIPPNAWRFSALELVALADWKASNRDAALKIYQQLADDSDAPKTLRARAAEISDAFRH